MEVYSAERGEQDSGDDSLVNEAPQSTTAFYISSILLRVESPFPNFIHSTPRVLLPVDLSKSETE